jgi:DNA-binding transcriptional LysR family regulator
MIDRLEMFLALAEARHFGRAAEARGVSQPSLSAAIKALEDDLGTPLVRRGARFQGLTPEGERALAWARRIVADARQMRAEMRARASGLGGALRLGAIPTALPHAGRIVATLLARHPNLSVSVASMTARHIRDAIEALTIEAGLTYLPDAPDARLATLPIHREGYRLLVRRDDPLAGRTALDWVDLTGLRLCLLDPAMQNRRIVDARLAAAGVEAEVAMVADTILALAGMVAAGGGWASIVPDAAAQLLAGGGLAAVPLREFSALPGPLVGLIAPDRDPPLPAVSALWDAARAGPRAPRPAPPDPRA